MKKPLPNHIAIIPDGNRRWAREQGLPTFEGHRKGFDVGVKIARYIRSLGIHTLTVWAFSTENFNRTQEEVSYLMRLYEKMLDKFLSEALKDNVRIIHLGRKDRIPKSLLKKIENVEQKTHDNAKHILNLALDYGGRDEILRAIKRIHNSEFIIQNLEESNFAQFLDTAGQPYPDPDLIIRTSGEMRTSGLMIWQAAYAEYIFFDKHFPDLKPSDIDRAISEFAKRQRRFGK
ncbi:MAG: di-trans,poly-cis-decaprenylcistransferase [Candidatus Levybacteria bacterium]|nr:di-trans,poly-cis-decaprenylcistransferase [Candidatus Levybacteria bacterium]